MASVSRRVFFSSCAVAGVAASAGCAGADDRREDGRAVSSQRTSKNPYDFGAIGDGVNDDTPALRAAYEAATAEGGGTIALPRGRFHIPGNLDMGEPGVSLVSEGGAVIGGGEVRVGPVDYDKRSGGVQFYGDRISGIVFDRGDEYGDARCLVLRNVRGLDVSHNVFMAAGRGIAVETADGNEKVHTTAMLTVANNRFTKLVFGLYGDTQEWDTLSDWQVTDNYFNFCSDTSVWIASTAEGHTGGVDGLNFAGNTIFSMNHNSREDPLFANKRYNLRLGRVNWLRIINNNFFEAGLSAVYLDSPQHFTFVGNHVAWPGQRELADALEIHNGKPTGIVEGNTFANWTRAAVGLYDLEEMDRIEIGQNAWNWSSSPNSWTGTGDLPGYRVYASTEGSGHPIVRDFQMTGTYDDMMGDSRLQSRDIKSPKGGVSGSSCRALEVAATATVFKISDVVHSENFGGLISVTATSAADDALIATYLLFLSSQGAVCTVIESGGLVDGDAAEHPSFTWALSGNELQASPVGAASGTYNFDAVGFGSVLPA